MLCWHFLSSCFQTFPLAQSVHRCRDGSFLITHPCMLSFSSQALAGRAGGGLCALQSLFCALPLGQAASSMWLVCERPDSSSSSASQEQPGCRVAPTIPIPRSCWRKEFGFYTSVGARSLKEVNLAKFFWDLRVLSPLLPPLLFYLTAFGMTSANFVSYTYIATSKQKAPQRYAGSRFSSHPWDAFSPQVTPKSQSLLSISCVSL